MTNKTVEYLIKNIKKYRREKKLTQLRLSELADISCDYLSEIERGKKTPSVKRLHYIASALDIEAYKLLLPIE